MAEERKFEVDSKYLGINAIDIKPVDVCALIEKPVNFIRPANDKFKVTDLTHRDRWRPYRLTINKQQHVVLLNPLFAENKSALDYLITILQRSVSLIIAEADKPQGRLRIETEEGLISSSKTQSARLVEFSTFCDLVSSFLNHDLNRHGVIVSLLHSFGVKLQTHVENAVLAKFPMLGSNAKRRSKINPLSNSLKDNVISEAPPQSETAMSLALHKAQVQKS